MADENVDVSGKKRHFEKLAAAMTKSGQEKSGQVELLAEKFKRKIEKQSQAVAKDAPKKKERLVDFVLGTFLRGNSKEWGRSRLISIVLQYFNKYIHLQPQKLIFLVPKFSKPQISLPKKYSRKFPKNQPLNHKLTHPHSTMKSQRIMTTSTIKITTFFQSTENFN